MTDGYADRIDDRHRRAFREDLLDWFERVRRPMPWRETDDPYRIWISEVMLQQTRVDQAWPYYERFTAAFPTVEALATAPLDDVLRLWEGLGYYSRARNLHRAAKKVVNEFGGRVPDTEEAIRTLPGVGPYTAAAVLSIAYGRPLAVLDGTAATGVRGTAAVTGRAPGTVSKQLAALRSRHLVSDEGEPLVPALFEAVVEVWQPTRVPLAALPETAGTSTADRLGIHFDDLESPGWVLADTAAAAAWGAPVVTTADAPPDFYVPDASTVARARALFGEATYAERA